MKKPFALFICLVAYLSCFAQANPTTPEAKALKKIQETEAVLTLTPEQVSTLKTALVYRYEAIRNFELKHQGNKELIKSEKKKQKATYKKIFENTLTKEQLKKWKKHKEGEKKAAEK